MPDGNASDCVLCHPKGDGDGPWPGVLHLTDIGGIRPAQIAMVEQLAAAGYTVLMPNLFYRTSRPPVKAPGLDRDKLMARLGELTAPLTPGSIAADAQTYLDCLSKHATPGTCGVVGYCYSGAVALRIAAAHPGRVAAAASFHGGGLYVESDPISPHLALPSVTARLYFGHAVKDPFMPEASIEAFDRALADWGGRFESEVYDGAYHSWTAPDSPVYNAAQATRAFGKLTALLENSLGRFHSS